MSPILLTTKDVMRYSGRGAKYSRSLIVKIQVFTNKPKHLPITLFDFCDYHLIPAERFYEIVNKSGVRAHS